MEEKRYGFGKNWAEFIEKNFSEERINVAKERLLNFLKLPDLKGRSFLDIGCGSGIHSLAAYQAGAERVVGFDYDHDSVKTSEKLRDFVGGPPNWKVGHGSVLDSKFVEGLQHADIVYSWGVLHHTGDMWKAIENAVSTMKDDGVLFIALYTSDVYIDPPPRYWLKKKQNYNRSGKMGKKLMEWQYASRIVLGELRNRRNPFTYILGYQQSRGMSFWTDVKDWLGGWPMEFAGISETKAFCSDKLGLELLHINAGEANTEYLFRKNGAKNYWDNIMMNHKQELLVGPFIHQKEFSWVAPIKQHETSSDNKDKPYQSNLMLFENGVPLGFAHAPHSHIQAHGCSRYSHWGDRLIFSTTDNSDPNTNGRTYSICPDML